MLWEKEKPLAPAVNPGSLVVQGLTYNDSASNPPPQIIYVDVARGYRYLACHCPGTTIAENRHVIRLTPLTLPMNEKRIYLFDHFLWNSWIVRGETGTRICFCPRKWSTYICRVSLDGIFQGWPILWPCSVGRKRFRKTVPKTVTFERVFKEAVVAYSKYYSDISLEGRDETKTNLSQNSQCWAQYWYLMAVVLTIAARL
jgi:hypothetical protein